MWKWLVSKWNAPKTSNRYMNRTLIALAVGLVLFLTLAVIETC